VLSKYLLKRWKTLKAAQNILRRQTKHKIKKEQIFEREMLKQSHKITLKFQILID
jgi:hypothetical protein